MWFFFLVFFCLISTLEALQITDSTNGTPGTKILYLVVILETILVVFYRKGERKGSNT